MVGTLTVGVNYRVGDVGYGRGISPAVGILGLKGSLLQVLKVHHFRLVRDTKFFKYDGHLPRVGPSGMGVEGDGLSHDDDLRSSRCLKVMRKVI